MTISPDGKSFMVDLKTQQKMKKFDELLHKRAKRKKRPSPSSSSASSCSSVVSSCSSSSSSVNLEKFSWKNVVVQSVLGTGNFASVYEVTIEASKPNSSTFLLEQLEDSDDDNVDDNDNGSDDGVLSVCATARTVYALKCLDPKAVVTETQLILAARDLVQETSILTSLHHNNIVRVHGMCDISPSQSYREGGTCGFFFLMEVLTETLTGRIAKWKQDMENKNNNNNNNKDGNKRKLKRSRSLDFSSRRKLQKRSSASVDEVYELYNRLETVIMSIVKAMIYLHDQKVLLLDLKPENVGFDMDGTLKLFDFGLSRSFVSLRPHEIIGSYRYMSPEMMVGACRGSSTDVYSFAILFWEVITLKLPFEKLTNEKELKEHVVFKHLRPSLQSITKRGYSGNNHNKGLTTLLQQCWHQDPNERPKFKEIKRKLTKYLDHGYGILPPKEETYTLHTVENAMEPPLVSREEEEEERKQESPQDAKPVPPPPSSSPGVNKRKSFRRGSFRRNSLSSLKNLLSSLSSSGHTLRTERYDDDDDDDMLLLNECS